MKQRIWIGGSVFILAVIAVWGLTAVRQSNSSPPVFRTVPIEKGDLVLSIPATGLVEPRFSVEIKSKASGEVRKVMAEEGDRIEKGVVLVEIDPQIEEIALRRAKADLMSAEARVKKAKILLERARLARSRKGRLHSKGFLSDEEKEEVHQEEGLREADLVMAQAELLRTREALSEAEERLKQTQVVSPLSGVVLSLFIQQGQIISSGTSSFSQGTLLGVVGDLTHLQIRAEVDETDARRVAVGQEAHVRFDAFPGRDYRARISRVAPLARIKNDLSVIDILLSLEEINDSADGVPPLRPGLSADVEVITRRLSGVFLLPREGIHREEGQWGVSVVQGKEVSFHPVKIGPTDGERVEIETDLPEGTEVAIQGGSGGDRASRGRPGRGRP
ncbi:MAG: efflux RND transporter periplasmic adaptor subunit [Nitrospiria bacterium]